MKKFIFLPILFFLFTLNSLAQDTGAIDLSFQDQSGNTRLLSCYVPLDYDENKTYPLYLCLHANGLPASSMRDILQPAFEELDAILLCPDENNFWDGVALQAGFGWVNDTYNLDASTIIAGGLYTSANVGLLMPLDDSETFKGSIILSPIINEINADDLMNAGGLRFANIQGDADENYNLAHTEFNKLEQSGASVLEIVKQGMGDLQENETQQYYSSAEFVTDFLEAFYFVSELEAPDPAIVKLDKPEHQTANLYKELLLRWRNIVEAEAYKIQIATDNSFNNLVVDENTSSSVYEAELEETSMYYWRVASVIDGNQSGWSATRVFTTAGSTGYITFTKILNDNPFNDDYRAFHTYVPETYDPSQPTELFIGFHGMGQPTDNFIPVFEDLADEKNFIAICPDGNGSRHDDEYNGNEINICDVSLELAKEYFNIDEDWVFLSGYSYGGREALYYALHKNDVYKGVLAFAPAIQGQNDIDNNMAVPWANPYKFENANGMKMAFIYGIQDQTFYQWIEAMSTKLQNNDADLAKFALTGDHGSFFVNDDFPSTLNSAYQHLHTIGNIDKVIEGVEISLYPNPATEYLNININSNNYDNANLIINDLNGNTVLDMNIQMNSNEMIELNKLSSGEYFLQFNIGDETTIRKIVINK